VAQVREAAAGVYCAVSGDARRYEGVTRSETSCHRLHRARLPRL